jgi:hypothetical protein
VIEAGPRMVLLGIAVILALLAAWPPANTRVGLLPLAVAFFAAAFLFA